MLFMTWFEVVCMTWVVCATWVVCVTWVVCTHLGLLTSVSRGYSVVSLLVEAGPPFCPYWAFLSHEEEGVVLFGFSDGDEFFLCFRSLLHVRRSVYGGGLLLCFVLCVACRTVFVILLVTPGQLMFCSSSLHTWFSSRTLLSNFVDFNLLQVNISMIAGVLMYTQIRSSIKCDKTVMHN